MVFGDDGIKVGDRVQQALRHHITLIIKRVQLFTAQAAHLVPLHPLRQR